MGDLKAIAVVGACILGPLVLSCLLIAVDMRTDLSELNPRQPTCEGTALLGWKELAGQRDGPVRMLGYMMNGDQPWRDGTPVSTFVLMPKAGVLLHPAQSAAGATVAVRISHGKLVPFHFRSLVWARGILRKERTQYIMEGATAQSAEEREIGRWFTP